MCTSVWCEAERTVDFATGQWLVCQYMLSWNACSATGKMAALSSEAFRFGTWPYLLSQLNPSPIPEW